MSEVHTTATVCFDTEATTERWMAAFAPAKEGHWPQARTALAGLGLKCVEAAAEGMHVSRLQRFGRRIELRFMELDLDSAELLTELTEAGATHLRASSDDSRTGTVTKFVRIGKSKAKEAEFIAAVAEFDDDFAFFTALEKGKSGDVKKLLARGISPNLEIRPHVFPIHMAVNSGKKPLVKLLIDAGANVNVQTASREIKEDGQRTPLHLAVSADSVDLVELLLKNGADPSIRNAAGQTPLYVALRYRRQACCKLLMERGADPHTVDESGRPALFNLSYADRERIPEFLVFAESMGFDLSAKLPSGENLHWALGSIKEVVHFLEARGLVASPPADAYTGDLPRDLFHAILKHDVDKVKVLIAEGVDPDALFDYFGNGDPESSILQAARRGHADVLQLLLDAGANPDTADARGFTLLHAAAYDGYVEVAALLISRGANPNATTKEDPFAISQKADDPMLQALDEGHIEVAKLLMPQWKPTQARLDHAKKLLKFLIEHKKKGEDAVKMLAALEEWKLS